jgi:hypothetical protein
MTETKIAVTVMFLLSIALLLLVIFNRALGFWGDFGLALISLIVLLLAIGTIHEWRQ